MKRVDYLLGALGYLFAVLSFVGLILAGPATAQTPAHDTTGWHPPGFGHEHGDPPPSELQALIDNPDVHQWFPDFLNFAGEFSTSPAENTLKHNGMKGYDLSKGFTDQLGRPISGYIELHAFEFPMDRQSQKHSIRMAIKDADGGWTLRQGWINMGDRLTADYPLQAPKYCSLTGRADFYDQTTGKALPDGPCAGVNPYKRPILWFVDEDVRSGRYTGLPDQAAQWYASTPFGQLGLLVNSPTYRQPDEKVSDSDPHLWHATGALGQVRQLDFTACRPGASDCAAPAWIRGLGFYTDQDGHWRAPDDPECSKPDHPTAIHCLLQYVSPTYEGVKGQKANFQYPVPPDIGLPN